ncbi:MAG: endonuclease/exonuclease/phosphatase family metal-dependent hydrolase [Myxococcota bacterium]|jgi:endonuclease/exonuclease/phosphatase family metal-dependent hydrolase
MLGVTGCVASEPVAEEGVFSVITYNVQGLPDALTDSARPTLDRMQDIAPLLDAYDVVGIQEDFDEDWHAALVADASHDDEFWTDEILDGRVYSAGLAVLSRLSPEPESTLYRESFYSSCHGTLDGSGDCLASKGFQVVTLTLAGGLVVDIVNTHHEAGGGEEDIAARAVQVEELIADLNGSHAVVFMGDTNLDSEDVDDAAALDRYAAASLQDVCGLVGCAEDDHIDRIFIRSSPTLTLDAVSWERPTQFVGDDGEPLSDHPAIAAEISWTASPER